MQLVSSIEMANQVPMPTDSCNGFRNQHYRNHPCVQVTTRDLRVDHFEMMVHSTRHAMFLLQMHRYRR